MGYGAAVARTREQLLDAAEAVLATEGAGAVTIRRVARDVGLSHGAPLRHFPTLPALLGTVATRGFAALSAAVRAAADGVDGVDGADPRARLRATAGAYTRFALERPALLTLMFRHDLLDHDDPALADAGADAFGALVSLVVDAQLTGWHPQADPRQLAGVLWASVHGMSHLWLTGGYGPTTGTGRIDDAVSLMVQMYALPSPTIHPSAAPDPPTDQTPLEAP